MAILLGGATIAMAKETGPWEKWRAIKPVWVDAYSQDEMKNGHFNYRVWGGVLVLRRWVKEMYDIGLGDYIPAHWEYKPYRLEDVGK